MNSDRSTDPRSTAVEDLQALGLSAYAARTYVALVGLGDGTAREVSEVSDVPRTRVYDAVDELSDRGLVDVHNAEPKRFRAVSTETTARKFEGTYRRRIDRLTDALEVVGDGADPTRQRGVWTVQGEAAVTDRVLEFLRTAEDEVVYATVAELLDDDVVSALAAAADRGVDVRVAGLSPPVEDRIRDRVPGVETFESLWTFADSPAGRLLMVDRSKTLVGVLVEDAVGRDETAIWGSGQTNSLVVVLKAVFTWRLDGDPDD